MEYNISDVIKRLEKAQKGGKELINKSELLRIAMPKINSIDEQIMLIDRGLKKMFNCDFDSLGYGRTENLITFSIAEQITGIPRQTYIRWKKKGIITTFKNGKLDIFSLKELKETLLLLQLNRQ